MTDLYELLGVAKTATKDEIKKAFRKKMKEAHPDREDGDHELAVKLNLAWDTLGNDEKRKRYDETGTIAGNCEPTLDDKARQCLAAAFAQMLADEVDLAPHEDPLARLMKAMKSSIVQYEFELKAIDSAVAKLGKKKDRVKFAGAGMDIWDAVIEDKKKKYAEHRLKFKEAIDVTNRSLDIIKDYQGQFTPAINPGQSELDRRAAEMQRVFNAHQTGFYSESSIWDNLFGKR